MGTDRLRVESNERVDLPDFDYAVDDQINLAFEQLGGQFLTNPEGQRGWILDGFAIDSPVAAQVRVTKGRAILSRREGGATTHGVITTEGDVQKIIDISTFADGTYGVYVRFQFVDGDTESRAFWDSSGAEEFTQNIATRRKANWSMRIEATNPGPEWHQVADVAVAGSVVSGVADRREFYFEGDVDNAFTSQWSTDADPAGTDDELLVTAIAAATPTWPGGSGDTAVVTISDTSEMAVADFVRADTDGRWYKITAITPATDFTVADVHGHAGVFPTGALSSSLQIDRSTDRANDGIKDLQTFVSAMRQSIEDIKGRGLRKWWERDIGGMNVGFDADPAPNRLAVGDDEFFLERISSTLLFFNWDGASLILFDRTLGSVQFINSGSTIGEFTATGDGGIRSFFGLAVGTLDALIDEAVIVGDDEFGLFFDGGVDPRIQFETDAQLEYNRANGNFRFVWGTDGKLVVVDPGLGNPAFRLVAGNNPTDNDYIELSQGPGGGIFRVVLDGTEAAWFSNDQTRIEATAATLENALRIGAPNTTSQLELEPRTTLPTNDSVDGALTLTRNATQLLGYNAKFAEFQAFGKSLVPQEHVQDTTAAGNDEAVHQVSFPVDFFTVPQRPFIRYTAYLWVSSTTAWTGTVRIRTGVFPAEGASPSMGGTNLSSFAGGAAGSYYIKVVVELFWDGAEIDANVSVWTVDPSATKDHDIGVSPAVLGGGFTPAADILSLGVVIDNTGGSALTWDLGGAYTESY